MEKVEICPYCCEDSDGFVKPLEKNGHAFIRFGMNGWEINLSARGWHGSAKIRYCPMCGRKLMREGWRIEWKNLRPVHSAEVKHT